MVAKRSYSSSLGDSTPTLIILLSRVCYLQIRLIFEVDLLVRTAANLKLGDAGSISSNVTADGEWITTSTSKLVPGDKLLARDGRLLTVSGTKLVKKNVQVYNFTVDHLHTYFVGQQQWLVHNVTCPTTVQRDNQGRITDVYAVLNPRPAKYNGTDPTPNAVQYIRQHGKQGDDAGHIVARQHGGSGGLDNTFAQNSQVNQDPRRIYGWRDLEDNIAKAINRGDRVSVWFQFFYDDVQFINRPSRIMYSYTINGAFNARVFPNP